MYNIYEFGSRIVIYEIFLIEKFRNFYFQKLKET